MQVPILMPQLGLTMTEGTVTEWLKKPGDAVKRDEFILVVSTDKADVEIESSNEGKLTQIVVEAGTTVPVGAVIGYIDDPKAVAVESQPAVAAPASEPAPLQGANTTEKAPERLVESAKVATAEIAASPRARKLAKELGVDIARLQPQQGSTRIVEEDVRRAARAVPSSSGTPDANRRRVIAEKMAESARTIPDFTVSIEVDGQELLTFYKALTASKNTPIGVKITLSDLLIKALGLALRDVPQANAVWADGAVVGQDTSDLALAVATDRGVTAPVLRNVAEKALQQIAAERNDIAERARSGRLGVSEFEGAVGTLTNLGMHGVDEFQAIITPGQSFVLAVGRIRERPWVDRGLVVRPTVKMNLTMDHRVADGVTAAQLLARVSEIVTNPSQLAPETKA